MPGCSAVSCGHVKAAGVRMSAVFNANANNRPHFEFQFELEPPLDNSRSSLMLLSFCK